MLTYSADKTIGNAVYAQAIVPVKAEAQIGNDILAFLPLKKLELVYRRKRQPPCRRYIFIVRAHAVPDHFGILISAHEDTSVLPRILGELADFSKNPAPFIHKCRRLMPIDGFTRIRLAGLAVNMADVLKEGL